MKRVIAPTLAALALVACSESSTAPLATGPEQLRLSAEAPLYSKGGNRIEGDYIVVFKDDVAEPLSKADEKIAKHAAKGKHTYGAALKGFAATLTPGAVAALRADPDVAYIEEDGVVTTTATQSYAPWGLDRIDQRSRPLSGTYTYAYVGTYVTVYIIDTGIQTGHTEFGGRAAVSYDAFGGSGQDCNGHGTHVAGTVGAKTYGVAKGVKLRAVRVLDCAGSGSNSGVIAGMDWVTRNHVASSVANMSLGGGYSSATNTAANNLANSGVFLAVAAGNSNANACNYSPASAANATSVMASTSSDAKASFSNYGSCTHLYAPGASIKSTWLNGGTNTISGTSMASPHVAGVAALYKAHYGDASYTTIRSWLVNNSSTGKISGNPTGTPNRLLFSAGL